MDSFNVHVLKLTRSSVNKPLVPTVVFESDGPRGSEVHTTSADAPKQVGLMMNWMSGF